MVIIMQSIQEKQYKKMLNTPIPTLILKLSTPAVIGMLITVLYNTADTYFVSMINKSASAAVGAVYSIMAIIQAVGYGFSMGAGSLVSILLGKNDREKADMYGSSAFFAAFLSGTVIAVFGLMFLKPFLKILGCSKTMMPYAVPYAKYILAVAPLNCSTFVLNGIVRSSGQVATSMISIGISGLINTVLDPLFIFTFGLGTGGAAIATALSQTINFIILLMLFVTDKSVVKLSLKKVSRDIKNYGDIISTGLPTVFRQGMGCLSATLLNVTAVKYGDAALAAITIANKVYVLVRNVVLGVGQGFQPVAGYNYGAGNRKRTWNSFLFTCLIGTGICLFATAFTAIYAKTIMEWFSKDSEVILIGTETLYFACTVMPLMAVSTYVNQMYQCLGFKKSASFLASCRQGIFFVPIIIIAPIFMGCQGAEITQPLADLLTFIISVPFMISFYRKHIKEPLI